MTWFGWDASNHDWGRGSMDLNAAVADGITYFTHKATEGGNYRDPYVGEAMRRAKASGLTWYGTYFVPRSNTGISMAGQVNHYLSYLDSQVSGWRTDPRFRVHQVDTEHWGIDKVPASYGVEACALLARLGGGKQIVHYAPQWSYGNGIAGREMLWASNYGANPAVPWRQAYRGDGAWPSAYSGRLPAVWQFGSKTRIGTQNTCDINAIKDPLVWLALTGGSDMAGWTDDQIKGLFDRLDDIQWRTREVHGVSLMQHWGWAPATFEEWKQGSGDQVLPGVYERIGPGNSVARSYETWQNSIATKAATTEEKLRDAGAATQLTAMAETIKAMAEAIQAGGGSVEAAPILARIDETAESMRSLAETLHQAEMEAAAARYQEQMGQLNAMHANEIEEIRKGHQRELASKEAELAALRGDAQ